MIIGRITRPHGIRGEVKVRPETDFPERFHALARVLVVRARGEAAQEAVVENVRPQGAMLLLKLRGVEDLEAARALQDAALVVPREERVPLPAGAFYIGDLIGLSVRTAAGEVLGTLAEVLRTRSNDVYRVEGPGGEVLIPALAEVVRTIDLSAREMIVDLPEGLR